MTNKNRILIGVSAAAFLGPFTQTVYTPSLPELASFFQVNTVMVNLTISLFTAILALSNFFVGPIADRKGRRATLLPGLLVFSFGCLVCWFSTTYWYFLAGRAVQAVGICTALLMAPTVIGDIYPLKERAPAMGVFQQVTFLGPVLGPVVGGLIAAYLHWQWAFALLAVAGLAVWLYNRSELPETLPKDMVATRISFGSFRQVLANRSALSLIMLGFSQFYGYYSFLVFLPMLLESLAVQPGSSEGFFFLPLTAGILAGIHASNIWQRRWSHASIVSASSFAMAANVLLFWMAMRADLTTIPLLVVMLLVFGVLLGCSLPVQSTILVSLFTKEKATAVGAYNFFRFSGAAAGPIVGGFLQMTYGLNAVLLSLGLVLLGSAWVIRQRLVEPT